MTIISYIVLALAVGIQVLLSMRDCAEQTPIQLNKGLLHSAILAIIFILMMGLGIWIANIFLPSYPDDVAGMVTLGIFLVVIAKIFFGTKKGSNVSAYDISRSGTMVLLSIALGINVFLLGLGAGFVGQFESDLLKMAIPMFLLVFPMSMWGIMLGRNKIDIRPRRWRLISVLCLLVVAVVSTLL